MWKLLRSLFATKEKSLMSQSERDNGSPDVVFNLSGDALRPTPAPFGFIARNPLGRPVMPGQTVRIALGVSANKPMLAFPLRRVADYVRVLDQPGCVVLQPGEELWATVMNAGTAPMMIEDKEGLVSLYPLVFSGSSEVA